METKERQVLIEPTRENIEKVFSLIREFAVSKGYEIKGELKLPTNMLGITKSILFESKSIQKVVRTYLTRLCTKVTMGQANRFLHMFFKKVLKSDDQAPRVEYCEKERQIRDARKLYRTSMRTTEKLQKEYKEIKGDFYKIPKK